jgi:gamma-glutamyltranspeptidase/glutathione hydrolase
VDGEAGRRTAEEHGVEVWEHPPNGQGIVALMALGILEELEKTGKIPKFCEKEHYSASYLHAVVEALRIAFADASWWVTDPNVRKVPTQELISNSYLAERAKLFDPKKASPPLDHGSPAHNHSDCWMIHVMHVVIHQMHEVLTSCMSHFVAYSPSFYSNSRLMPTVAY